MNSGEVQFPLHDLDIDENKQRKQSRLFDDKVSDRIDRLSQKVDGMSVALNRCVLIGSLIIAAAIVMAAFISRPRSGARYRSIGTNRIFDVQTGEVKWADQPEEKK